MGKRVRFQRGVHLRRYVGPVVCQYRAKRGWTQCQHEEPRCKSQHPHNHRCAEFVNQAFNETHAGIVREFHADLVVGAPANHQPPERTFPHFRRNEITSVSFRSPVNRCCVNPLPARPSRPRAMQPLELVSYKIQANLRHERWENLEDYCLQIWQTWNDLFNHLMEWSRNRARVRVEVKAIELKASGKMEFQHTLKRKRVQKILS